MTFGDTSPGAFLCVYVGRISKEKRLDVIVEAVKNIPGAYLAIIGDGPSAAMYAATHGKESRIYCKPRFLSHVELAEIYASSDLHVSASQFETLGNTVLEAFACGIPVVVPRCQGFCDTVIDDKDGFLFEPGNSSSAQGYIEVLKNDPVKRAAMGEHGRVVVSSHTVSHVVKDLIAWYKRGIEKQREGTVRNTFFVFCALLATVPIAIIALWCYERLVRAPEPCVAAAVYASCYLLHTCLSQFLSLTSRISYSLPLPLSPFIFSPPASFSFIPCYFLAA
jgi:Glycosyl transferases group 1